MDFRILHRWDVYYFLQGFWLDIKILTADADTVLIAAAIMALLAVLLLFEIKRYCARSWLYVAPAALYYTFLLTVSVFGRSGGSVSSVDQLFITYERAFEGEQAARLDILYNIVLYIPVGLLISRYRNNIIDTVVLLLIPVIVELTQLYSGRGIFEISDIINNFAGGIIGLFTARVSSKLCRKIKYLFNKRKGGKVERAE